MRGEGKPKLERREKLKWELRATCVGKELGFCPERLGSLGKVFGRGEPGQLSRLGELAWGLDWVRGKPGGQEPMSSCQYPAEVGRRG